MLNRLTMVTRHFKVNFCRISCLDLPLDARVESAVGHNVMDEEQLIHLIEMRRSLLISPQKPK